MHAQESQQGRSVTPGGPAPRAAERGAAPAVGQAMAGAGFSPAQVLALQRSAGNAAVAGLFAQRTAAVQCSSDHEAQLPSTHDVQRSSVHDVQRSSVHDVLRGSGRPLDSDVRADMESRLGADFGDVRVHNDVDAQRSAAEIGARAYTSGNHVVVGRGGGDRHTLAHELTHVIQQRQGPVAGTTTGGGLSMSDPSDAFERAAEANATRALSEPVPDTKPSTTTDTNAVTAPDAVQRASGGSSSACPVGPAVVQRAVGFEFEAQWNVRRVADPAADTAIHEERIGQRDRLLHAKLLELAIKPQAKQLTEEEKVESPEALRARWFDGEFLNAAGERRLEETEFRRGGAQRAASEMSLMISSQIPEAPLLGENLGKGRGPEGVVVRGTKYDLTADASPSGGSNLEWVTDPLDTVAEVGSVLDNITRMTRYLDGRQRESFIPSEDVTAGGGTPEPHLRIYPFRGALSFAPQTTAGMRLDRLPDLIGYLADKEEKPRPKSLGGVLNTVHDKLTHAGERRTRARRDLFAGGLGTLPTAKSGAERAVGEFGASPPEGLSLSKSDIGSLTGLVTHLGAYVLAGEELQAGANAKSIAGGLMARTDFAHNYGLLPQPVQEYFRAHPDHFADLVLTAVDREGNRPLFGAPVERGLANDRTRTTIALTRSKWLRTVALGHDLLKNAEHMSPEQRDLADDEPGSQAIHKSLGALGDQDNSVTVKKEEIQLMVAELRRMEDRVPAERLKPLAVAAFKLIDQLNRGKDLKYAKRD